MSFLDGWLSNFGDTAAGGVSGSSSRSNVNSAGNTESTQEQESNTHIDQEGLDYLLNNILSGTQGLAAVSSGKNAAGVYNSATNDMLTNQLLSQAAGEVASRNVTTDVTGTTDTDTSNTSDTKTSGNKSPLDEIGGITVICTHFHSIGILDSQKYYKTHQLMKHQKETLRGYHWWAIPAVRILRTNSLKSKLITPFLKKLTLGRAAWICESKKSFFGFISIYVITPICWFLGKYFIARSGNYKSLYAYPVNTELKG